MSIKATIEHSFGVSDMVVGKYLSDLDPEAFFARPVPGMNHLAWQVGHLISSENKMMEKLKPGSSPALPAGFHEKHAMAQHTSDIPADFLTKDEYLSLWQGQRAATKALLAGMSEADLDATTPDEKTRQMCPTVGTIFNLTALHYLMHAGQFVAVRRQREMPVAF